MRRVWPYLVLAGCYSDRALEIIVQDPDGLGVTHVELFIGRTATEDMEPVALPAMSDVQPQGGSYETAVWWSRLDAPTEGKHPSDIEPMGPQGARYQILPSLDASIEDVLASVVAVGYALDPLTARKTPLGVGAVLKKMKVPTDGKNQYLIDLLPYTDIGRASDKPGLRLWGGESRQACVQVDAVPGLELHDPAASAMIVRGGDLDCDGLGDLDMNECFPDRFMAQAAIPRSSLSCAYSRLVGSNDTPTCIVGGATCADGTGARPGVCSPSSYCMPTLACSGCSPTSPCNPYRAGSLTTNPFIECTVYYSRETGQADLCELATAALDLAALFPTFGLECDQNLDAKLRQTATSMWNDTIEIRSSAASISDADLRILPAESSRADHSCDFDLHAKGPLPPAANMEPLGEFNTTVSFPLSGPVAGRGILMPLHLQIIETQSCQPTGVNLNTVCRLKPVAVADDALFQSCLRAAAAPDTVVPD